MATARDGVGKTQNMLAEDIVRIASNHVPRAGYDDVLGMTHQRTKFIDGGSGNDITGAAGNQQHRHVDPRGSVQEPRLVLVAIGNDLFQEARIPVPAPAAAAIGHQQLAQVRRGARVAMRKVSSNGSARLIKRLKAVCMRLHESGNARYAGNLQPRRHIDQHQGAEQARVRLRRQTEQAAHRRADEQRRMAGMLGDTMQILKQLGNRVIAHRAAFAITMAACIECSAMKPLRGQRGHTGPPSVPGLAQTMGEHYGWVTGMADRFHG